MTRTLILPGLHDSDPRHWQSRWEARDDTLLRVIQDDWETPHCADWIAKLDQWKADTPAVRLVSDHRHVRALGTGLFVQNSGKTWETNGIMTFTRAK
jgi:predicted alpha/beta hydrolase family esterase